LSAADEFAPLSFLLPFSAFQFNTLLAAEGPQASSSSSTFLAFFTPRSISAWVRLVPKQNFQSSLWQFGGSCGLGLGLGLG